MKKFNFKKISVLTCLLLLTSCSSKVEYPYPVIEEESLPETLESTNGAVQTSEDNIKVNFYYDNTRSGTYYVANRDTEIISDKDEKKVAENKATDPNYVKFSNFFKALLVDTNKLYDTSNYTLQNVDKKYQWKKYNGSIFEKMATKDLYTFDNIPLPTNEEGHKTGPLYMLVYNDIINWNDGINLIFTDLSEQYCRNIELSQLIHSKLSDEYSACVLSIKFKYTGALSVPTIDEINDVSASKNINDNRAYHLIMTGPTDTLKTYSEKLKNNLDEYNLEYNMTDLVDNSQYDTFENFIIDENTFSNADSLLELLESEDNTIADEEISEVYTDYNYNFEPISLDDVKRDIFSSESVPNNMLAYTYYGGTVLDYASVNLTFNMADEQPTDGVNISYHLGSTDEMKVYYCAYPEEIESEEELSEEDTEVSVEWFEMSKEEVFANLEHCEIDGNNIKIATDFGSTQPISPAYYISVPVYENHVFDASTVPDWYTEYHFDTKNDSLDLQYTKTFQYKEFLENLTIYSGKQEEKCIGYVYILLDALPYK